MADIGDRAAATEELQREYALRKALQQKEASPEATGECLFCGEPIEEKGRRWCDAECRDGWQARQRP